MIKLLLLPALLLMAFTAICQDKVLLTENFKNNKNGWRTQKNASFYVDIRKGVLHLEKFKKNFDDRGCLWYRKEIKGLNTAADFSVTFYAKFLSGGDHTDMIDIQWGAWDKLIRSKITGIYQLNFLLKGDVKLDYFNMQWNYSFRYKAKEILNRNLYQPSQFNKFELIQKDGFIILNINDEQYFKQFAEPISGTAIGFQQCLKSAWEIDKIIVKQLNTGKAAIPDSMARPLSIDSVKQADKLNGNTLQVYPNPFINELTLLLTSEKIATAKIELYDIQGNLVLQYDKRLDAGEQAVRLYADVLPGTYVVKATVEGKVTTAKIVKL